MILAKSHGVLRSLCVFAFALAYWQGAVVPGVNGAKMRWPDICPGAVVDSTARALRLSEI